MLTQLSAQLWKVKSWQNVKLGGITMNQGDLMNLCYSCLIDGTGEHAPITLEEAAYTLQCWKEEGNELAEETADLTAEEFMDAWNHVFWLLHFQQ